jgi:hypothetical protein
MDAQTAIRCGKYENILNEQSQTVRNGPLVWKFVSRLILILIKWHVTKFHAGHETLMTFV